MHHLENKFVVQHRLFYYLLEISLKETENHTIAFYIKGFKEAIQDEIFLICIWLVEDVNLMALKSEEKHNWLALKVDPKPKHGNMKVTCFKIVGDNNHYECPKSNSDMLLLDVTVDEN